MEIIVAVGFDAAGVATNLYTGPSQVAGEAALRAAVMAGSSIIGHIYSLSPGAAHVTLRY